MRTPLCAVLAVSIAGCSALSGGDTAARLDAMEQQMAVVIERVGTLEESNDEIMNKVEEVSKDTSTSRRLSLLEEKQAGMEKMQLEMVSHQESMKNAMAKVHEYIKALDRKVDKLSKKQQEQVARKRRKSLEERLRQRVQEESKIQEIPRNSIIRIEKPPARLKKRETPPVQETTRHRTPSAPERETVSPPVRERPVTPEPSGKKEDTGGGGFILEDF